MAFRCGDAPYANPTLPLVHVSGVGAMQFFCRDESLHRAERIKSNSFGREFSTCAGPESIPIRAHTRNTHKTPPSMSWVTTRCNYAQDVRASRYLSSPSFVLVRPTQRTFSRPSRIEEREHTSKCTLLSLPTPTHHVMTYYFDMNFLIHRPFRDESGNV